MMLHRHFDAEKKTEKQKIKSAVSETETEKTVEAQKRKGRPKKTAE